MRTLKGFLGVYYCNFHQYLGPRGPPRDTKGPLGMSRDIKGYQGGRRIFRKLHSVLRNLKGLLGAFLMRVRLISVFKLVCLMFIFYWQVTDPNVGFLVNRKNVNIHIEWLQSFILFQSTYQHYDDITKIQTYQMRYYTYSMIHE